MGKGFSNMGHCLFPSFVLFVFSVILMAFQVMFKDEKWFPDLWEEITWEVIKITEKTKKNMGKPMLEKPFHYFTMKKPDGNYRSVSVST